jgi:hypothetical protein
MRPDKNFPSKDERGVVIIWFTFFLLFTLCITALGIDGAKLMATRTQLQNAADAAALAGASAIDPLTGSLISDTATVRAMQTANQHLAFTKGSTPVTLLGGDITFPADNTIRVVARRSPEAGGSMITQFAQVIGIGQIAVSASASAKSEPSDGICEGLVPMAPVEDPAQPFQVGCEHTYVLKLGGDSQQGNFQLLAFPDCEEGECGQGGGGSSVRCLVANGYGCCINIGDMVDTQPGNKSGPFTQGLDDRWSRDSDQREDICFEQYTGNRQRVVLVPLVRTFDVNGKKPVEITGFSAFFLRNKPSGGQDLTGEFLYAVAPGAGGSSSGGTSTLFSIRLIQ